MAKPTGIRQRGRSWEAFVYDPPVTAEDPKDVHDP